MNRQIKLMASEYEVGDQTELLVCPFCNGGSSDEPSFTMNITNEGILYLCYRASCSRKGFVPNLKFGAPPAKKKKKEPNMFTGDISPLQETMIPLLVNKFPCMTQEIIEREQIKYSHERERFLIPMFDARGYEYGLQARSYNKVPKAISYFNVLSVPKLHFPLGYTPSKWVVLVEDQFSAMILCDQGIPAIALLGTNLSEEDVAHLYKCGIREIIFFLDADAANKAIKFKKEYSLEFKTHVYYHPQDPKDLKPEQIKEFQKWIQETL